jgi:hypothetical protein
MHSSTGIKKQIKIRRSDNGAPVVVEVPGGSKINESNQDILTEPINLKVILQHKNEFFNFPRDGRKADM